MLNIKGRGTIIKKHDNRKDSLPIGTALLLSFMSYICEYQLEL